MSTNGSVEDVMEEQHPVWEKGGGNVAAGYTL